MPTPLPSWALKLNYWYIANRGRLRYWTVVSFLIIDGLLVLTFLIQGSIYLAQLPVRRQLFHSVYLSGVDWTKIKQQTAPADLVVVAAVAVPPSGSQTIHLVADVKNPNEDWYARKVIYHWEYGGQTLSSEEATVMPGQKKVLARYNQESASGNPTIVIDSVDWQRFSSSTFTLPSFTFSQMALTAVSGTANQTAQLTGLARNDSVNTYDQVRIVALLYLDDVIVGVNEQRFDTVSGFAERAIDMRWFVPVSFNARLDLRTDVDTIQ